MTTQQTLQIEEYKQTELGELPKEWEVVKLGDYCKVFSGFAFKSTDFVKEGVLVVKIGNIQNGTVVIDNRTNYFPKEKIIGNIKKFILKKGEIIIAMTGATTGKVGVVPKEHENSLLNQRVGKFDIFSRELDNNFFRYFSITNEFQGKVLDNILKSAQGNVSPKQIKNINISLPPLPEQQKIAYILSTVQTAQEKTENYINSLKELKKSAMKHLFTYGAVSFEDIDKVELKETEIGMMPKGWGVNSIGNLFDVQQGKQLSAKESKDGKQKKPFLRTSNLLWGKVTFEKIDYMYFTDKEIQKLILQENDILVCEGGDVGRTALWRGELKECIYQNHLHRLRPKIDNYSPQLFLYWMDCAIQIMNLYVHNANRTTIPNISSSRLKEFIIPLPPLPEQQRIASILSAIDDKIQAEEQKKEALKETFNSLLKDLMTAKIRVNNLEVGA
jgi:type I restriction enzyme S subunit